MKKTHIFILVVIGAAIALIVSTAGEASTYASFRDARALANDDNAKKIHVVGELKKNEQGQAEGIELGADKVSFSFWLIDENKQAEQVFYNEPMPPDFTRSEKVVVVGCYRQDKFMASKILLKCPSKYEEKKL